MSETNVGRPGAGTGTPAQTAGEDVTVSVTDATDTTAVAVPVWIRHRGGDPVTIRRRQSARLADLLDAPRGRMPEPYAAGGMCLTVPEREAAASAPIRCAA